MPSSESRPLQASTFLQSRGCASPTLRDAGFRINNQPGSPSKIHPTSGAVRRGPKVYETTVCVRTRAGESARVRPQRLPKLAEVSEHQAEIARCRMGSAGCLVVVAVVTVRCSRAVFVRAPESPML